MNKIVIPVSYMGSGSSALTDLLSEFKGYEAKNGDFEYVFLHCPNGLFDLEMKLLQNNTSLRSDEALHSFQKTMKELYDKKYYWVGNYKEHIGSKFMDYTNDFIDGLIEIKPDNYWYYQENTNLRMFFLLVKNKLMKLLSANKLQGKKPLVYDQMWLSYIKPAEFYEKSKVYLNKIWSELGLHDRNIVLDQLLLPQNIERMHHYFEDNAIAFVVDRDPRDVFILNKYVWAKDNQQIPYPNDVKIFCSCYRKLRQLEKETNSANIMRVHFEDLIYDYDDTVKSILGMLDLNESDHIGKLKKFNPEISIHNTQVFRCKPEYIEEVKIIEEELKEFLYAFPYENKIDLTKSF